MEQDVYAAVFVESIEYDRIVYRTRAEINFCSSAAYYPVLLKEMFPTPYLSIYLVTPPVNMSLCWLLVVGSLAGLGDVCGHTDMSTHVIQPSLGPHYKKSTHCLTGTHHVGGTWQDKPIADNGFVLPGALHMMGTCQTKDILAIPACSHYYVFAQAGVTSHPRPTHEIYLMDIHWRK
jgi:hypothetical protein